jgi:hypothetical protein
MRKTLFLLLVLAQLHATPQDPSFTQKATTKLAYISVGVTLGVATVLGGAVWALCYTTPKAKPFRQEALLFCELCHYSAKKLFYQAFCGTPLRSPLLSWNQNKALLSQMPAVSDEERKLLQFLERRWLAKVTGFFSQIVNWVCPCFGVSLQVHPDTTNHYARSPWQKLSKTYTARMEAWKKVLPHPDHFPLILTRPHNVMGFLSGCIDLTDRLPKKATREEWRAAWKNLQPQLSRKGIYIERVYQEGIGGIRILPLERASKSSTKRKYQSVLKWISTMGLAANFVELDRAGFEYRPVMQPRVQYPLSPRLSLPKPEGVMERGAVAVVQGLLSKVYGSSSAVATVSLLRMAEQLQKPDENFFGKMARMEQIYANLSNLLELYHPYALTEFSDIYLKHLPCIPRLLKQKATGAIHASAMTTLTAIFKILEKSKGEKPCVIYGENTYFECIQLTHKLGKAKSITEVCQEDFAEADLIVAQFNPALRRVELQATTYDVEDVSGVIKKCLKERMKPLTVALDCTLDYIDSGRVKALLEEFEKEILAGKLNLIGYRSGTKFDLFGMDNYCGAPFFILAAGDEFEELLRDPALQTDVLSYNWFCLAYEFAAQELDAYRKAIFDNTRQFLRQLPQEIFKEEALFRVVPVEEGSEIGFVDIKVSGPLHQLRGACLVGGSLYLECMKAGHPIFCRPSLGFYHPNFTMIFGEDQTTIRLTLGLEESQIAVLVRCFERLLTIHNK